MNRIARYSMLAIMVTFGIAVFTLNSHSNSQADFSSVSFSSGTSYSFFDAKQSKVYVYSQLDGSLEQIWQVEELGKSLKLVFNKDREGSPYRRRMK